MLPYLSVGIFSMWYVQTTISENGKFTLLSKKIIEKLQSYIFIHNIV